MTNKPDRYRKSQRQKSQGTGQSTPVGGFKMNWCPECECKAQECPCPDWHRHIEKEDSK